MTLTGAEVKERLQTLGEGEDLTIDGNVWTCIGSDFFLESVEFDGTIDRNELDGEFEDAKTYEVTR